MSTEHENSAPTNEARDAAGKFAPGNRGGPGNPFARQVAALRKALIDSVTPQDIQDVAGRLVVLAKEGNVQAAKLLFTYVIGKPQPAPEPDRMDVDEWDVYRETTPMKTESAALMRAGVPEYHLNLVRTLRPVLTALMNQEVQAVIGETPEERDADAEAERVVNSRGGLPEELEPSPNGSKRRPSGQRDRFQPSTNGEFHRNGTSAPPA